MSVQVLQFLLQQSREVGQQQWLLLCKHLFRLNSFMRGHLCLNSLQVAMVII